MGSNWNPRCTTIRLNNDCVNNSSATFHLNCPIAFPGTRSGFTSTLKWINCEVEQQNNGNCSRNSFELIVSTKLVGQVDLSCLSVEKVYEVGHSIWSVRLVSQVGLSSRRTSSCRVKVVIRDLSEHCTGRSQIDSEPFVAFVSFTLSFPSIAFRRFQDLKTSSCEDS